MAMARLVSQALTHHKSGVALPPRILSHRHRSGKAQTAQIIEVDLDSSSSSSASSSPSLSSSSAEGSDADAINGGIKKLEEVIQNIIVRRAAPDWLPFLPGSSYWVPPPRRNHPYGGVFEVIGRLSTPTRLLSESPSLSQTQSFSSGFLSEDETMSFSSHRGWPSSSYFIQGSAQTYPVVPLEVEVEVKSLDNSESDSTGRDEEG